MQSDAAGGDGVAMYVARVRERGPRHVDAEPVDPARHLGERSDELLAVLPHAVVEHKASYVSMTVLVEEMCM